MTGIAWFVVLPVLNIVLQSCSSLARASFTDDLTQQSSGPVRHNGHGLHNHHHWHHKGGKLSDEDIDRDRTAEVTFTPGGALHRGHSMMRRESENAIFEDSSGKLHHKSHDNKALFRAIDLNADGKISQDEVEHITKILAESPDTEQSFEQALADMVGGMGIFSDGAHHREHQKQHHGEHHKQHHREHKTQQVKPYYSAVEETEAEPYYSAAEEHRPSRMEHGEGFSQAALNERSETFEPELKVSCGGHRAPDCAQCPTYFNGNTGASRGEEFCHHDCRWCSSGGNTGTCIDNKTGVCVTSGNIANDHQKMPDLVKKTPDVYDPNITTKDQEIINDAAEAAIREENLESAEKQRQEEEEAEGKKFSWSKFWLIVVITFSVILGICAIISVVALVVFCCMGASDNAPKELVDEGDDDGEGEGEDEADGKAS